MFIPLPHLLFLALTIFISIGNAVPAGKPAAFSSAKWKSMKARSLATTPLTPAEAACAPDQPTAFNYTCWDALDIDSYLRDWWMNNRGNCNDLGFAQCFLQNNHYAGLTCDLITTDTCTPPDSNIAWDSLQQFYAVWNIYAIHQFFSQYYTALGLAQSLTLGRVGDIVVTIMPPESQSSAAGKIISILIALSFGLFAMGKEALATTVVEKMRYVGMTALAGQGSQMVDFLMGPEAQNNYNQETIKITEMQSKLSDMTITYMNQITALVKDIQGDPVKFLKLCSAGGFTQRITTSLPSQVSGILDQLTLYILGAALKDANSAIIVINENKNPVDMAISTGKILCDSLDNWSSCNQWWYDADTDTTYTLENTENLGDQNFGDKTHKFWNSGWATPKDFYTGDDPSCNGLDPWIDDNAVLHCGNPLFKCIAANVTFDGMPKPSDTPEFTNCANSKDWMRIGCAKGACICAPCSYMGPELALLEMVKPACDAAKNKCL